MEGDQMKIGTFLLGGIAGAAAVVYLNRKSKSMLFSAFSSSSESVGKAVDKAKNTFVNKSFTDSMAKNFSNSSANNLNQVEKIVKEDPNLKVTVSEILQENKENTSTIQ
jgi:Na+-transporting NADH:ubiquinone oxidoreductase subunit NqrC